SEFEKALNDSIANIVNFLGEKQQEKEELAKLANLDIALLTNSFEKEKERIIVERKRMLSAIYNTYIYRISQMILADQNSLRISEERQRAKAIAQDIQKRVNEELSRSINEKLDELLSKDILNDEDLATLSAQIQTVYKQGIEIWAKAAVDLVENEHKWYENYDKIYNSGIDEWTKAINELVDLKNKWIKEFSEKINEAMNKWDETELNNQTAKENFLKSIENFQNEQSDEFDKYIQGITKVLNSGKDTISSINSYIQGYISMLAESLGVFAPSNIDISQIYGDIKFFTKYLQDNKNDQQSWIIPEQRPSYNDIKDYINNYCLGYKENLKSFKYNPIGSTIIDNSTGKIKIEYNIEYVVSKKYKEPEGGWSESEETRRGSYSFYLESTSKNNYAFYEPDKPVYQIIKEKLDSNYKIQDYDLYIYSTTYENGGFIINYAINVSAKDKDNSDIKKTIKYSIKYTLNGDRWIKQLNDKINVINGFSGGVKLNEAIKILDKGELNQNDNSSNLDSNSSYFARIKQLGEQKNDIVSSIANIQKNIINMLSDNIKQGNLLENYKKNDENAFESILSLVEDNVYLSDLDVEVLTAYHKQKFWNQQKEIIEGVLNFALNSASREDAQV
ncbi:MAG: hypothetical protein WH035_07510, partial [Spirochaetota bacterium]